VEFELEPASIIELRRSILCYRSGRRARNRHQAIAVQYRSAGLEAIAYGLLPWPSSLGSIPDHTVSLSTNLMEVVLYSTSLGILDSGLSRVVASESVRAIQKPQLSIFWA
jgi:hypothetical protein